MPGVRSSVLKWRRRRDSNYSTNYVILKHIHE
jgi:hypothetical protein